MKFRFRCLHKSGGGLPFDPSKNCAVICVTAMLHNIATRAGGALDEPELPEDEEEFDIEERPGASGDHPNFVAGFNVRRGVRETFFKI